MGSDVVEDWVDRNRLRKDPEYLLSTVCSKFLKLDRYQRGLLTSTTFDKALQELGLRRGQQEVDTILRYCTVTADGYVHYKELMRMVAPKTPRAKQSSAKVAIFPEDEAGLCANAQALRGRSQDDLVAERSSEIRKLYVQWERSMLSNERLKDALQNLGLRLTESLDRLLTIAGPSRAMPFAKLLQALHVEENDGRRARANAPRELSPGQSSTCLGSDSGYDRMGAYSERSSLSDISGRRGAHREGSEALRQCLCDFIDGRLPAVSFRQRLSRHGVYVSPQLDRLISRHEQDGSARFQDLLRLVQSQGGGTVVQPVGQSEQRPFASGGDWDACSNAEGTFDCAASVASSRSGVGGGYPRSSPASAQPPWATTATLWQSQSESSHQSRARSSKAPSGSGDVIGWRNCREDAAVPPKERLRSDVHDVFQWSSERRDEECDHRFGKRYYTPACSAAESAPFGRDTPFGHRVEVGSRTPSRIASSVPFGTDADNFHSRPEHAGTDEYRGASMRQR
eukprot:TRINITY_DN26727_c0_g2_i1.p1 TRINITY_DN26727_c0_g2~~TRINITY_DN26727_c0_g2_i1.p1  ORF type:complete len:511 (+),score=54.16 TRINITY_DN26727_c0_g2_i1:64-1596(+)